MTEESLANILADEEAPEVIEATEQTVESEPEVTEEPEVEQVEEPAEPTAAPEKEESWTKQAVLDERRKRQDLEGKYTTSESENAALKAKLEEAEKKLSKVNTEIKKEEAKAPDVFEDPEGYAKYQKDMMTSEAMTLRIELSQDMMRMAKDDYDAMEKIFVDKCCAEDASLGQKLRESKNPAKFAYDKAKEFLDRQDYEANKTSYTEWKKAQEAAKEAEEQEEVEESPKEKAKKSARKVPDLLNATSATSGNANNESLKSILGK